MQFFLFILFLTASPMMPRPIGFKSFQQFDAAWTTSETILDKATADETTNPTTTLSKSLLSPKNLYQWLSFGHVLLSIVSSTGLVFTCWCGIKLLNNSCICKSAWFYPKSFAEYRHRKQNKIKNKLGLPKTTFQQPVTSSSPTSSSPPTP